MSTGAGRRVCVASDWVVVSLASRSRAPAGAQSAARSGRGPPSSTSVSSGAELRLDRLRGSFRDRNRTRDRANVSIRAAGCPLGVRGVRRRPGRGPSLPRGDVGKGRQIDPKRQGLAALPALSLIDEQNFKSVGVGHVGVRREKGEHIGEELPLSQSFEN